MSNSFPPTGKECPSKSGGDTASGGEGGGDGDAGDDEKKRQKRGGKGMVRLKKKEEGPKKVRYFNTNKFVKLTATKM